MEVGDGSHRRCAGTPVDERDLAERLAGPEPPDLLAVNLHRLLAALYDEGDEPALALERDRLACRGASLVDLLGQGREIRFSSSEKSGVRRRSSVLDLATSPFMHDASRPAQEGSAGAISSIRSSAARSRSTHAR